jgi:hypothetical protein
MHDFNITFCISLLIAAVLVKGITSLISAYSIHKRGIPQLVNMGRYKIRARRFWVGEAIGYCSLAIFLIVLYLSQV